MPSPSTRPAARLVPALWVGLAAGTTVAATVAAAGLGGSAGPVSLGTSVTRAWMDVAGVACVGLGVLGVLLPPGGTARSRSGRSHSGRSHSGRSHSGQHHSGAREVAAVRATSDRALVVLAGWWLAMVSLGTVFRAADAFGRPVGAVGAAEVVAWVTRLGAGRGMVLTAGCAAVVLGCAVVRLLDPDRLQVRIPLVAALLGVLTPALTGHAGSAADHQVAVVTVALHVGAAALWVGGLGALLVLVARRPNVLDAVLPRFSRLAGGCLVAVGLTGVLNAVIRLESWDALLSTGYGLLVVAKAVCLMLIGWLGGLARHRLAAGRTPVLRWAGTETALMAATLGLAAALTQTG